MIDDGHQHLAEKLMEAQERIKVLESDLHSAIVHEQEAEAKAAALMSSCCQQAKGLLERLTSSRMDTQASLRPDVDVHRRTDREAPVCECAEGFESRLDGG